MSIKRSVQYLIGLIHELRKLPKETEWLEFKCNKADPEEIGEYISALANSATLTNKATAYLIWGIDDVTHEIVGTSFQPSSVKVRKEELESWLLRQLSPRIHFQFHEVTIDEKPIVLLEIPAASKHPVQFINQKFIRVGSYKKKLREYPEKERILWQKIDRTPFEHGVAAEHVASSEVLSYLDYPAYFDLLNLPLPDGRTAILDALKKDGLIQPCEAGDWNITNLGAILFAKKLQDFPSLERKALRIIHYEGKSRIKTLRERISTKGYASNFEELINFIMTLIPSNEIIEHSLRKTVCMFPELAIRELVANALIHQNFFITGTSPMVEIFDDRIEITNPGKPLIDPQRFIDNPPKSRNEALASLMRRFRICEERGSGIDRVIREVELYQLPAPIFEAPDEFIRVILFAHRPLGEMSRADRVRACYLHACLKRVMGDFLTNTSLRERFGIEEKNKATASRYIREALDEGVIKPFDESAPKKMMKYIPFWA